MFGALEAVLLSPRQKRAAEIHDLIHLGFRISPGSFIQDIWMGLSAFHVLFFAKQYGRNSAKLDELVKSPLTFWTTTFQRLSNLSNGKCSTHNFSVIAMNNFVRVMKEEVVPVDQQLDTIVQQQIAKNRTIMASLFKTVLFVGAIIQPSALNSLLISLPKCTLEEYGWLIFYMESSLGKFN